MNNMNQKFESQIGALKSDIQSILPRKDPHDRAYFESPVGRSKPSPFQQPIPPPDAFESAPQKFRRPEMPENFSRPPLLGTEAAKRFRAQDIGYFEPASDGPSVEVKDSKNIYHRVFTFVNRIRVCVDNFRDNGLLIAENLDTCLLGSAHTWYNRELNRTTHTRLRRDPELWCEMLERRFRESPSRSQAKLDGLRYSVKDAISRKDPEDYFSDIIESGSNAGIFLDDNEYAQCIFAWRRLAPELRVTIPEPVKGPYVRDNFLQQLSSAKDTWFDLYAKKSSLSSPYTDPYANRASNSQSWKNRNNRSLAQPYFPAPSPHFGNPANLSNPPNFDAPRPRNLPVGLPLQKPPNQIVPFQRTPNSPNSLPLNPLSKGNMGPQLNQRQFQRVYTYDIDGNLVEMHPSDDEANNVDLGDSADTYNAEPEPTTAQWSSDDLQDQAETTGDTDTIEANIAYFAQLPEIKCRICHQIFKSNNELHRHLKSHFRSSTLEVLSVQPSSPKPPRVILSDAAKPCFPPGYAFTGYKFTTAKCQIGQGEFFDACLDTGCTASLADADFITSLLPDLTVQSMPTMLNVKGIGSQKHSANRWVLLKMKFMGVNNQLLEIEREIHLVDDLKAKLLIGVDILDPEGIIINIREKTAIFTHCQGGLVPLTITNRNLQKTVFAQESSTIPPHSRKAVLIRGAKNKLLDLPSNRRLLFEPTRLRVKI